MELVGEVESLVGRDRWSRSSWEKPESSFVGAWRVGRAARPLTDQAALEAPELLKRRARWQRASETDTEGPRAKAHRVATEGRQGNRPGLSEPSSHPGSEEH